MASLISSQDHGISTADQLSDVLDQIRIGITVFDGKDFLVYCNEHFSQNFPTRSGDDDPIGRSYAGILRLLVDNGEIAGTQVLQDPEVWIVRRLANRDEPFQGCEEEQLAAGRWVEIKERPTPAGDVIATWADVTDQKKAKNRLADVIENISDGFVLWDAADGLSIVNSPFAKLYGNGEESLQPGEQFHEILTRSAKIGLFDTGGDVDAWIEERVKQRMLPEVHYVRLFSDGRSFMVSKRRTRDGGRVTVLSDITPMKKAEDGLQERGETFERMVMELEMASSKLEENGAIVAELAEQLATGKGAAEEGSIAKSRFLSMMSHELRTPLNAIIGFSEIIDNEILGPVGVPHYREYAHDIHASGNHFLEVINDILDLSKIEVDKLELYEEQFDPAEAMESSARLIKERAERAGIDLYIDIKGSLPRLTADQRKIRRININLLSNAVKFTPEGGSITLSAGTARDGGLVIAVSDTGIGVAPEDIEKIFQPFDQLENEYTRKSTGTGLGLPLTKALAELHGKRLEIESTLGAGTTVTIHLPPERVVA